MENAAKALVIAGGILLAIMTLTILVYGITTTGRIAEAQDQAKKDEEIAKFNMEFEAYDKKRMFGIDLISVINKAIDNNAKMDRTSPDSRYYINIIFTTEKNTQDFKNEIYVEKIERATGKSVTPDESFFDNVSITVNGITHTLKEYNDKDIVIHKDTTYSLGNLQSGGSQFITDNNFKKIFTEGTTVDKNGTYEENATSTYIYNWKLYSALTNFKKAVFKCEKVEYSPYTKRIYQMEFRQIDPNDKSTW